jgi:hypothetical protein
MKSLLKALTLCSLLAGLGCQKPPTTEPETVDAVQKSESETQAMPGAAKTAAIKPIRRQRSTAKATSGSVAGALEEVRPASPVTTKYTLPAETEISVRFIDSISTETNKVGDTFLASLAEPLTVNGVTLFARDTSIGGKILNLEEPGRVSGVASISLQLTEIQPKNGSPILLATQPFSETAKAEKKKDAAIIGGGTAIGTAIGAITGGKKGAAIGAIAGGGSSTGYVLATKGKQLEYPSETLMTFKLAEPLTVTR